MADDESRTQRAPTEFPLHRQSSGEKQRALRQESIIHELISMGEPLPVVLNNLCTAVDLQIGNVVSVISLALNLKVDQTDSRMHNLQTVADSARQFGLHVFWSGSIALPGGDLLGSLEVYCRVSRAPTALELQLFDRVMHLAALAIQRHHDQKDFESFFTDWKSPLRRGPRDLSQPS